MDEPLSKQTVRLLQQILADSKKLRSSKEVQADPTLRALADLATSYSESALREAEQHKFMRLLESASSLTYHARRLQDAAREASGATSRALKKLAAVAAKVEPAVSKDLGEWDKRKRRSYAEGGAVHGYEATQAKDGTWTIHDVPVFSVHTDERRGEPEHYDEDWLYRAVKLAQGRERHDGYLGPLHKQHHPNPEVQFAGKFRLTGVRDLVYEGEPTPTIYADFVDIPDEVYQEIKQGRFPYRSVEIPGPEKPEVLSIALLDHEVPYFRYANMRIAKESTAGGRKKAHRDLVECVTYDLDEGQRSVTFNYDRDSGMESALKSTLNLRKNNGGVMRTYDNGNLFAMDEDNDDETEKKAASFSGDASGLIGQIMDLLQQLADAMGGEADAEEQVPEEEPPVAASLTQPAEQRSAAQPSEAAPVQHSEPSEREAAMAAELAAMKAQLRAMQANQQQQQETTEAERAERAFADAGATDAEIEDYRKLAKEHGAAAAAMFAKNMEPVLKSRKSQEPPRVFGGDLHRSSVLPPEVMAYQAKGPEVFAEAQAHYAAWNAGSKRHQLSTYLAAQLDEGSFFNVNGARTGAQN